MSRECNGTRRGDDTVNWCEVWQVRGRGGPAGVRVGTGYPVHGRVTCPRAR